MYNGWLHCVFVTNCACFSAAGLCVWAKLNYYGSWNDGEMSRGFRDKLKKPIKNTAFPVSEDMFGRIITPLKEGDIERASPETRLALRHLSAAITSIRQSAEWGMGCVDKVYRILHRKLPYNQMKRSRLLDCLYRLYNYRVRTTGISQIKNYFESE